MIGENNIIGAIMDNNIKNVLNSVGNEENTDAKRNNDINNQEVHQDSLFYYGASESYDSSGQADTTNTGYSTPNQYGTYSAGMQNGSYGGNQYGTYNTGAQNSPYGETNGYNPYIGNPNYGGGKSHELPEMLKLTTAREKKRIVLGCIAVVVLVMMGFGSIKLASFFVSNLFTEQIYSIEGRLEEKYNVSIKVGDEADITEDDILIESLEDKETINEALCSIEEVLDRLPENFLDEVMDGYREGRHLEINITGHMLNNKDGREIVGLTTYEETKDVIRLDGNEISWKEFKLTFAHELFHVIDFEMTQFDDDNNIKKWSEANPSGFKYSVSEGKKTEYTKSENNPEYIFFVSLYSKEDIYEDRAEIFSYLLAYGEGKSLPEEYESPHVREKVELLIEELEEHFSSAEEDAYWNSWDLD